MPHNLFRHPDVIGQSPVGWMLVPPSVVGPEDMGEPAFKADQHVAQRTTVAIDAPPRSKGAFSPLAVLRVGRVHFPLLRIPSSRTLLSRVVGAFFKVRVASIFSP